MKDNVMMSNNIENNWEKRLGYEKDCQGFFYEIKSLLTFWKKKTNWQNFYLDIATLNFKCRFKKIMKRQHCNKMTKYFFLQIINASSFSVSLFPNNIKQVLECFGLKAHHKVEVVFLEIKSNFVYIHDEKKFTKLV